jgi:hypothetical protein
VVEPNTSVEPNNAVNTWGGGSCQHHRRVLEALIVLDVPVVKFLVVVFKILNVPVVELLVVVVEIAGRLGEGILGAAAAVGPIVFAAVALGPARASQDGLAHRIIASGVELLVVVFLGAATVGPIVRAAVALGPARASRDGLALCFVASGNAVLEALVVLTVDLLLV